MIPVTYIKSELLEKVRLVIPSQMYVIDITKAEAEGLLRSLHRLLDGPKVVYTSPSEPIGTILKLQGAIFGEAK